MESNRRDASTEVGHFFTFFISLFLLNVTKRNGLPTQVGIVVSYYIYVLLNMGVCRRSGVEVGDVIIQINGAPVHNVNDIYSNIANIFFEMEILKNGKTNKVVVKTRHS